MGRDHSWCRYLASWISSDCYLWMADLLLAYCVGGTLQPMVELLCGRLNCGPPRSRLMKSRS